MAIGPIALWKKTAADRLWQTLKHPLTLSALTAVIFPALYGDNYSISAAITVFVASWVIYVVAVDVYLKASNSKQFSIGLSKLSRSYYGMVIAHIGVATTVLGAGLNTIYSDQRDIRMETGERLTLGRYEYSFVDVKTIRGPNYTSEQGHIEIFSNGKKISTLKPEKRRYFSTNDVLTEAAIDSSFWGDRYIALGEFLGKTQAGTDAWAIRIHDKPFVNWIWLGALLMALGGFLAIFDKRYRLKKKVAKKVPLADTIGSVAAD